MQDMSHKNGKRSGRAAAAATATAEAALRLRDCQRDAVERPSPSWIDSKRGTTKVEIEGEIHLPLLAPSREFFHPIQAKLCIDTVLYLGDAPR